ncbi:MAG TPA: DUF4390 domain-containing protein [Rhodanobacteraceae bacterium]|nr:DUF4390 domain-containing protein [Rhodanobacteraceae bacterium]
MRSRKNVRQGPDASPGCIARSAAGRPAYRAVAGFLSGVVALSILLAGCGALREQAPGHLAVRSAAVRAAADGAVLDLDLDCRLSGPMRDALDHGIPITLVITLRAGGSPWTRPRARAHERIELRYFPLSRRYQLHGPDAGSVRSFAASAYLVDALGGLRLPLPAAFAALPPGTALRVSVDLDRAALPGALRLPAIFEPAWRLSATEFAWSSAG